MDRVTPHRLFLCNMPTSMIRSLIENQQWATSFRFCCRFTNLRPHLHHFEFDSLSVSCGRHRMPKNMPRRRRSSKEIYHLEFANGSPGVDFGKNVNAYIRTLFKGKPPLKYASHIASKPGGKSVKVSDHRLSKPIL